MIAIFIVLGALATGATVYLLFVKKSRDFLKFLAGVFFVSGVIQFYLYLAGISVPILGTSFVMTPKISGFRSILDLALLLVSLYFWFIKKPK
jgi:hypothetical protein